MSTSEKAADTSATAPSEEAVCHQPPLKKKCVELAGSKRPADRQYIVVADTLAEDERKELDRLRKENADLKAENERMNGILNKIKTELLCPVTGEPMLVPVRMPNCGHYVCYVSLFMAIDSKEDSKDNAVLPLHDQKPKCVLCRAQSTLAMKDLSSSPVLTQIITLVHPERIDQMRTAAKPLKPTSDLKPVRQSVATPESFKKVIDSYQMRLASELRVLSVTAKNYVEGSIYPTAMNTNMSLREGVPTEGLALALKYASKGISFGTRMHDTFHFTGACRAQMAQKMRCDGFTEVDIRIEPCPNKGNCPFSETSDCLTLFARFVYPAQEASKKLLADVIELADPKPSGVTSAAMDLGHRK